MLVKTPACQSVPGLDVLMQILGGSRRAHGAGSPPPTWDAGGHSSWPQPGCWPLSHLKSEPAGGWFPLATDFQINKTSEKQINKVGLREYRNTHSLPTVYKDTKAIQQGRGNLCFQQVCCVQLDIHKEKMKLAPYLTPHTKLT